MGLTNDFAKFGVTFEGAYHRVSNLTYTIQDQYEPVMIATGSIDEDGNPIPPAYGSQWVKRATGTGYVDTYASLEARNAHSESLARTSFTINYDLDSEDTWIEQAYTHVKSLDAFTGSVDVL